MGGEGVGGVGVYADGSTDQRSSQAMRLHDHPPSQPFPTKGWKGYSSWIDANLSSPSKARVTLASSHPFGVHHAPRSFYLEQVGACDHTKCTFALLFEGGAIGV
jgi:hypothetical protein